MTAPSIACPSCGEEVPFGRRTCEACGASLTGPAPDAPDATEATAEGEQPAETEPRAEPEWPVAPEPPAPEWPVAPEPPAVAVIADDVAAFTAAEPDRRAEPPELVEPDLPAEAFVPPVLRSWTAAPPQPVGSSAVEAAAEAGASPVAGAWLPPSPAQRPAPPPASGSATTAAGPAARPWADAGPVAPTAAATGTESTPGAEMPGSLAQMLDRTERGTPRWPDGGARGSAPTSAGSTMGSAAPIPSAPPLSPSATPAARMPAAPPAAIEREAELQPGRASIFSDLPFDAPESLAGWLVVGGGGLATLSFLLPWVAVLDSYFSAWGLSSLANVLAFLLVLGTTSLSLLPNRLAGWLRHGILGLAVGGFLLGLTWTRLVGATGGQIGVVLEAAGALLLVIGGVLAIAQSHGANETR
jgi:hypothetical protein